MAPSQVENGVAMEFSLNKANRVENLSEKPILLDVITNKIPSAASP